MTRKFSVSLLSPLCLILVIAVPTLTVTGCQSERQVTEDETEIEKKRMEHKSRIDRERAEAGS